MQTIIHKEDTGSLAASAPQKPQQQQTKGLLRAFVALRHRNFRLFWSGQLISLTGTWMQTTAQEWLVLSLSHNALILGIVGALQFLPVMFLSLFGGVLADKLPKRRVLLFTQSFAMLQAATLCLLLYTGAIQLWHIYILAALLGLTNALDMPTRQAFVVEMVGRKDLPNAIALNSSMFNMARIVGPGIGGLLIAWLGEAPLFLLNALSFIPVLISLSLIDLKQLYAQAKPREQEEQPVRTGTFRSLREGFAYIAKTPAIFLVIAVVGWVSLFGINFNVILPLFSTEVLHAGPSGYGFVSSSFGIGALISALWLAWGNKRPSITHILIGTILFCILEALFAISHLYLLSILLIASVGFAQIAFSATANTTLQTVTPNHLRGRIMSVYMLFFAGTIPIGNLFVGWLARSFGASPALLICAAISLLAPIIGWFYRGKAAKSAQSALL